MARKPPKKPKIKKTAKKPVRRSAPKKPKVSKKSHAALAKKEFLRRSRAAKLGHQRRREKKVPATATARELAAEERARTAEEALAAIVDERDKNVVTAEALRFLRRDGSAAVQKSYLRHLVDSYSMSDRLQAASEISDAALDAEARKIRKEYDVSLQEVYTLFFSP